MNKAEYLEFHRAQCERMVEITRKKNADYTGDSTDPFANFTAVEKLGICSAQTGFLVRMCDKFCRIASLSDGRRPEVADEAIEDTLLDLGNYSILFMGLLRSRRVAPVTDEPRFSNEPTNLKLRAGGKYRTRNGKYVVCVESLHGDYGPHKFIAGPGPMKDWVFTDTGKPFPGTVDDLDLVEEVTE